MLQHYSVIVMEKKNARWANEVGWKIGSTSYLMGRPVNSPQWPIGSNYRLWGQLVAYFVSFARISHAAVCFFTTLRSDWNMGRKLEKRGGGRDKVQQAMGV